MMFIKKHGDKVDIVTYIPVAVLTDMTDDKARYDMMI